MLRTELPAVLGASFSVGDAYRAGVTRSRLDALDLVKPFHGVRARVAPPNRHEAATPEEEVLERAVQYATRMGPEEFFSHTTSAVIWGVPLPPQALRDELLDVALFSPRRHPRARGVRGHEIAQHLGSSRVHPETGLRVASPASTWAMLGSVLRHPRDLVAAADGFVREPRQRSGIPSLATLGQLGAALAAGRRVGVQSLRDALPRARVGSASRPETWLRLTIVDAGLPEPDLNLDVFDGGMWLARVDLAYPQLRVAIEYEGAHHLQDERTWTSDIRRYDRLAEAGWRVIRVTKDELFSHPDELVARVRAAVRGAV